MQLRYGEAQLQGLRVVGPDRHRLARKLVVLDTAAGPNFIRATELPAEVRRNVTAGPLPDIRDANGRPLRMSGTLRLSVQLGNRLFLVYFIVCDQLAGPSILGAEFCDKFVDPSDL